MEVTYRNIWKISYPVIISIFIEQLIGITDTAFMGHFGETELGASSLASIYYLIFYVIGSGFGIGLQILIARINGTKETKNIFWTGFYALIILSIIIIILSKQTFPVLLKKFIHSDDIYKNVVDYLNWRVYGLIFSFQIVAFRAYYVGITKTKILAVNSFIMFLANFVLNYILIFGKLGIPSLGIKGAAIGSGIAEMIASIILIIYTLKYRKGILSHKNVQIRFRYMKRILNLSIWTMLQSLLSFIAWSLFFISVEHLGEQALSITGAIRSFSEIPFIFVIAFASTESSMASTLIGENKSGLIKKLLIKTILISYAFCSVIICAGFFFPEFILRIYTNNEVLIQEAVTPFYVLLSSYLFTIPAFILYYLIIGTGNTLSSLITGILTLLVYIIYIRMLNTYTHSLILLWTSEHVYAISLIFFSSAYLLFFNWKKKKI